MCRVLTQINYYVKTVEYIHGTLLKFRNKEKQYVDFDQHLKTELTCEDNLVIEANVYCENDIKLHI